MGDHLRAIREGKGQRRLFMRSMVSHLPSNHILRLCEWVKLILVILALHAWRGHQRTGKDNKKEAKGGPRSSMLLNSRFLSRVLNEIDV